MDMEQVEKELRRKEEKMEVEAAEKAKRKNKESLLEDLVCDSEHLNKNYYCCRLVPTSQPLRY